MNEIFEITDPDMYRERLVTLHTFGNGLGPDDLVILVKESKSLISGGVTQVLNYHSIVGMDLSSEKPFVDYFSKLVQSQSSSMLAKLLKNRLCKGIICSWNSFLHVDTKISVDCRGEITAFLEDQLLTQDNWKQLSISTRLRYYRASQPLLYGIIASRFIDSPALHVYSQIPTLSAGDLEYAMVNHFPSDDFQSAISFALLLNFGARFIITFLEKYDFTHPRILTHLLSVVPSNSYFISHLVPLIEKHLQRYPDDLDLTIIYFEILIRTGKFELCDSYISILKCTMWDNPSSSIALAKYYIEQGDYIDAFYYLNIATFAKDWPSTIIKTDLYPCTKPGGNMIYRHQKLENMLIETPLSGVRADFFSTIGIMVERLGDTKFLALHKTQIRHKEIIETDTYHYENIFNPYFCSINHEDTNSSLLFDPGIDSASDLQLDLTDLPISKLFLDTIKCIQDRFEQAALIIMRKQMIVNFGATLLLGLQLHDSALIDMILFYFQNGQKASALDQIILLKASILKLTTHIDQIMNLEIKCPTVTQENALKFLKPLAMALHRLNQKTI